MRPFHFSTLVLDLEEARHFYSTILGLTIKREYPTALHYDFFGHQLVLHVGDEIPSTSKKMVDNHDVPIPHFGAILAQEELGRIESNLKNYNIELCFEGRIRFVGEPYEQYVIFVYDPSGNALEFKYYTQKNEYDY